jgi:hypothetical protein
LERNTEGREPDPQARARSKLKNVLRFVEVLLASMLLAWDLARMFHEKRADRSVWEILLAFALVALVVRWLPALFDWTSRNIGLEQIYSPEFEQRVRTRYRTQTAELSELGFDLLYFVGDSIPLFRMFLIFPAIIVFLMWRGGVPMTAQGGTRILTGNPVFISRNKNAFAHPNSLGVTFHTLFSDGMLLVSKNFGYSDGYESTIVANTFPAASIGATWAGHQEKLRALETGGRSVDRQTSFQAYAEITRRESKSR